MTHNEYQDKFAELWNDWYNNKITADKFKQKEKELDETPVESFDFSKCKLSEHDKVIINANFTRECKNTKDCLSLYSHTIFDVVSYATVRKLDLQTGSDGSYSGFFYNDRKLLILDFAEGDMYLDIFKNKRAYKRELLRTKKFYKEG